MAKIFDTIKKILLEKQVSKLSYQIELLHADIEILKKKLDLKFKKKSNSYKDQFRFELLEKEIKQLSNEDYLNYMTYSKLEKLDKRFDLKKRVIKTRQLRRLKKELDNAKIIEIDTQVQFQLDEIKMKHKKEKQEILSLYEHRVYDEKELKRYKEDFKASEKAMFESVKIFEKELTDSHLKLIAIKEKQIAKKINQQQKKLDARRLLLKPIIDRLNEINIKSIKSFDDAILQIENLTMNFGGLKAVDDLSFDVKRGEIFGLIGPNGAGKTTVFNCITQFYKPSTGKMIFKNSVNDIIELTNYKVHDVIKQGIVRTFQNVELIWELSILDNMLVGAHSLYRSKFFHHSFQTLSYKREEMILKMRAEKILEDLDLYQYRDLYPLGLPYGVLKRIELARTLMTHPSLIILDEPAAGLNDFETENLAKTIKKIQKDYDTTIFLVEHDMGLVMSICDTICAINFGKKLAVGTPKEIQNNPLVKEAYLGGE